MEKKDAGSNIISHSEESKTMAFKKSLDALLSSSSCIMKIKVIYLLNIVG